MADDNTPVEQRSEEPQSARGDVGSRDTGADGPSGGPVDRPAGVIDDDESVPSMGDDADAAAHGGGGTLPPGDADPVLPPYEGRQTHAKPEGESASGGTNAGAAIPTSNA